MQAARLRWLKHSENQSPQLLSIATVVEAFAEGQWLQAVRQAPAGRKLWLAQSSKITRSRMPSTTQRPQTLADEVA